MNKRGKFIVIGLMGGMFTLGTGKISHANADFGACDATCGALIDGSGSVLGISGSPGWTSADDAWCSQYGGTSLSQAVPPPGGFTFDNPILGSTPTVSASGSSVPGFGVTPERLQRCQAHTNSQLLDHCAAYKAAHGSSGFEKVLFALDVATTGTCAIACVAKHLQPLCSTAAKTSSVAEIADMLLTKDDGTSKLIDGLVASAGFMSARGLASTTQALTPEEQTLAKDNAILKNPNATMDQKAAASEETNGSVLNSDRAQSKVTADQKKQQKEACITAGIYAVMTGMRMSNMKKQDQVRQNECSAVKGLSSSAPIVAGSGGGNSIPRIPEPVASAGGSDGNGGSGTIGVQNTLTCTGASGLNSCLGANQNAATAGDARGLIQSGLDKAMAPTASDLLNKGLLASADSGGAAGAIQGALGGGVPGNIATQLAEIAKSAQDSAPREAAEMGGGGGGKSGGNGEGGEAGLSGLGSLLGQNGAGQGGEGRNIASDFSETESSDIWHQGSSLSLFQIVSKRMTQVNSRVDQLPWARGQNRALTGQGIAR